MPHSTNWRSANCKSGGLRNFFLDKEDRAAAHPHKSYVGYYILLLKCQNFVVCLSDKRLSVVQNGAPTSAEQYSRTAVRTLEKMLPKILWE